jgi:hypothetical protein
VHRRAALQLRRRGDEVRLAALVEQLEARFGDALAGLKLNLDGCPHACAHHWVGDLGFQGSTVRNEEGVAGRPTTCSCAAASAPTPRSRVRSSAACPAEELADTVTGLLDGWLEQRDGDESFPRVLRSLERRGARPPGRARACEEPERGGSCMSATELLDDLEAGELSVEFEGEEPEVVLEWGIERFGDRLAISTAFQEAMSR